MGITRETVKDGNKRFAVYAAEATYQDREFYPAEEEIRQLAEYHGWVFLPNRSFEGVFPLEFEGMAAQMEDLEYLCGQPRSEWDGYIYDVKKSLTQYLNEMIPKQNGKGYSPAEVSLIKRAIEDRWDCSGTRHGKTEALARIYSLITGKKYESRTLRGYSQGDWVEVLCPESEAGNVEFAEAVFFNGGTLIWVLDEQDEVEELEREYGTDIPPEEIRARGSFYLSMNFLEDKIIDEVAGYCSARPDSVKYYPFGGYAQIPQWGEAVGKEYAAA